MRPNLYDDAVRVLHEEIAILKQQRDEAYKEVERLRAALDRAAAEVERVCFQGPSCCCPETKAAILKLKEGSGESAD